MRASIPEWALENGSGVPAHPGGAIDLRQRLSGDSGSSNGSSPSGPPPQQSASDASSSRRSQADPSTGELPSSSVPALLAGFRRRVDELSKRSPKPLTNSERGIMVSAIENALDSSGKLEAEQRRQARHAVYVALTKTLNPHDDPAIERTLYAWVKPYAEKQGDKKVWRAAEDVRSQIRDVYREFIAKGPESDVTAVFGDELPDGVQQARDALAAA